MEDDRIEVLIGDNVKVQIIKSTITSLLKKRRSEKNNSFCVKFFKNKHFNNLSYIYINIIIFQF